MAGHPKRSRVELEISPSGIGDQPMKCRRREKRGILRPGGKMKVRGFPISVDSPALRTCKRMIGRDVFSRGVGGGNAGGIKSNEPAIREKSISLNMDGFLGGGKKEEEEIAAFFYYNIGRALVGCR